MAAAAVLALAFVTRAVSASIWVLTSLMEKTGVRDLIRGKWRQRRHEGLNPHHGCLPLNILFNQRGEDPKRAI